MENTYKLITLGIILATSLWTVIWTVNFAFAKNKNFQFEISDCTVQRNSTYEKSGPCTDLATEPTVDNTVQKHMVEPQIKMDSVSETKKVEPQIKVDKSPDNSIGGPETEVKGDVDNPKKYNFAELHITGSDKEVNKTSETKPIQSTLPKILEPFDPFGSAIK